HKGADGDPPGCRADTTLQGAPEWSVYLGVFPGALLGLGQPYLGLGDESRPIMCRAGEDPGNRRTGWKERSTAPFPQVLAGYRQPVAGIVSTHVMPFGPPEQDVLGQSVADLLVQGLVADVADQHSTTGVGHRFTAQSPQGAPVSRTGRISTPG